MSYYAKISRTMIAVLLFVVLVAGLPASALGSPSTPTPEVKNLIGLYESENERFLIRDRDGMLELLYDINGTSEAVLDQYTVYPLLPVSTNTYQFIANGPLGKQTSIVIFTRDTAARGVACTVGDAQYQRKFYDPENGMTFQIKPLLPADELLHRALLAQPPWETGVFQKPDLVELITLDPSIKLDIRYASENNFMGIALYDEARAFLQRPAAEALVRAHHVLGKYGYGIMIHDAYRPWYVTKMFWDATPDTQKIFVADPSKGSRHNRGGAVDVSLYDVITGNTISSISDYDEFSMRANPAYPGGTTLDRWQRDLLRTVMEGEGFSVYPEEWWHFDYKGWQQYPILNQRFNEVNSL